MSSAPNAVARSVDQVLGAAPIADVVVVRDGVTARCLMMSTTSSAGVLSALPRVRSAESVDDDLRTLCGEFECLAAADASPATGDDRHLPIQQPH